MPLMRQTVDISFKQGINTKTDSKQSMPGELSILENATFVSIGELKKRNGYLAVSQSILSVGGGTSVSSGSTLNSYQGNLTLCDGTYVYSYAPEASKWVQSAKTVSNSKLSVAVIDSASSGYNNNGSAQLYSVRAVASDGTEGFVVVTSPTRVKFIAYSAEGSFIIYSAVKTATSITGVTIQAIGNTFYIFLMEDVSGTVLNLYTFASSTAVSSWGSATLIDSSVSGFVDSCFLGTVIYLGYASLIRSYNTSGGATSTASGTYSTIFVTSDQVTNKVYLLENYGVLVEYSSALSVLNTYTSVGYGMVGANNGRVVVVGDGGVWVRGGTTTVFPDIQPVAAIASKIAFDASGFYITFQFPDALQSAYYICKAQLPVGAVTPTKGTIVTRFAYGSAPYVTQASIPDLLLLNGVLSLPYTFLVATFFASNLGSASFTVPQISVGRAQVALSQKPKAVAAGGVINYLCGNPSFFDGEALVDVGFNVFPAVMPVLFGATAGGRIDAGTYSYLSVYSYLDARGRVIRSAPGPAVQVTSASAGNAATFSLTQTPLFTNKSNITTEVYRTTNAGSVYYLTTTTNSLYFYDNTPDSTLVGNLQLYTTGGEVDNISPPPSTVGCVYKNRTMLVPDEFRSTIWYSKETIPGTPLEFSDLLVQNVDPRGGDITALAQLDDKLIIFKRDLIFFMVGDGPTPSGLANDFLNPQLIPTDTGCIDRDSVVLTPAGLVFKSPKGIYLLSRNLSVEYIGKNVEAYNQYTVTSAILIDSNNEIRITISNGTALVYNYLAGQWSVFTNVSAVDACMNSGTYSYLTSTGAVNQETVGSFTDNGSPIVLKLQTSWLSFAKMQGLQRVRRLLFLGEWKSTHSLNVSFAYNFDSTVTQTDVINSAVTSTPYQWKVHLKRQKCESVQITISDTSNSAYGESLSLANLAFEVGIKQGLNKVSSSYTTG